VVRHRETYEPRLSKRQTNVLLDVLLAGGCFWNPPVPRQARLIDSLRASRRVWSLAPRRSTWRIADGRHRLFAAYLVFEAEEAASLQVLAPAIQAPLSSTPASQARALAGLRDSEAHGLRID
jgi:hypothetical protein